MIEIKHKETGEVLHTVEADMLQGADLFHTNLSNANLTDANLSGANLNRANLSGANLAHANLSGANLFRADLKSANLLRVDFNGAYLFGASLFESILFHTNLSSADLSNVYLSSAYLSGVYLSGTDLSHVILKETTFSDCSTLYQAKGLETIAHERPSILDVRTLRACVNHLPNVFLQGVGYNQHEIDYLRSMYAVGPTGGGIRYYSCFLSYAHQDDAFAEKLYQDLKRNDVNCWKATYDIPTGSKWAEEIDKALQSHDKLVLVCSRRSIYREQVVREIVQAVTEERSSGRQMFFPINLDSHIYTDEVMDDARENVKSGEWKTNWVAHVRKYQAADFSQWQEEAVYQKALSKLLHDLKHPQKRDATGESNVTSNMRKEAEPQDSQHGPSSSSLSAAGQAAVGQMTGGSVSGIHIEQVHIHHAPIHPALVPQCKWSDLGSNVTAPKSYEVPKLNGIILILPKDVARVSQLGGNPTLLLREQAGLPTDIMTNYCVMDILPE